jgi:hypothetical protein
VVSSVAMRLDVNKRERADAMRQITYVDDGILNHILKT